jgi:hypothetical protein
MNRVTTIWPWWVSLFLKTGGCGAESRPPVPCCHALPAGRPLY